MKTKTYMEPSKSDWVRPNMGTLGSAQSQSRPVSGGHPHQAVLEGGEGEWTNRF
jgi:hypothetical protein